MDWWVHGISADWAFQQLMNASSRRDRRWYGRAVAVAVADDYVGLRERMLMMRRVVLVDPIGRWHAFNAIQFHSHKRKTPKITTRFLGFLSLFESKKPRKQKEKRREATEETRRRIEIQTTERRAKDGGSFLPLLILPVRNGCNLHRGIKSRSGGSM